MGKKPKAYTPSPEELALRAAQLEEMRDKGSEIAKQKFRMSRGAKAGRSLIKQQTNEQQTNKQQTLGA